MQSAALPDHVVSEVLAILLKYHPPRTEDGQLIDPDEWETFSPLQRLMLQERMINSAVGSFGDGLGRQLVILHRQQNNFSPIYHLPNEILALIFEALLEERYTCEGTYDIVVNLVQVSSKWRSVALSTARLWTHISSRYCLPLVMASIERSRNAALHIFLLEPKVESEQEDTFLQLMLPHTARWETFCWKNIWRRSSGLNEKGIHMPLLRKFEVQCEYEEKPAPFAVSHCAPVLQSLDITSFQLPREAPSFSRLREIRFRPVVDGRALALEEWYCLLASNLELEDIQAHGGTVNLSTSLTPFRVHLPHLKNFTLVNFQSELIGLLLSSISTNEDKPPSLIIEDSREIGQNRLHFDSIFPPSNVASSTLLGSIRKMTSIDIASYLDDEVLQITVSTETEPCLLDYHNRDGGTLADDAFRALVLPSVLPNLKEIAVRAITVFHDRAFSSILPLCTSLERLYLHCPDYQGGTNNLQRICNQLAMSDMSSVGECFTYKRPCPKLKFLGVLVDGNNLTPLETLVRVRYKGFSTHIIPENEVVRLEELRISTLQNKVYRTDMTHTLSITDLINTPSVNWVMDILHPLGTIVRVVDESDFD